MRLFVTLLLCSLAAGSLAASAGRKVRDADDGSDEEFLPAEFRSSPGVAEQRTIPNPMPLLVLAKLAAIAKVAVLVLVGTGTITTDGMSLPTEIQNLPDIQTILADIGEFVVDLRGNSGSAGSRQEASAREATLVLQDLNTLLDEGAVTAVAKLHGQAKGELSFAQARHPTDSDVTIISGTLSGLKPGLHKLQVTLKGDISDDCASAGDAYSDQSDGSFVANSQGKALVVVRVAKAPLRGTDTVLGRAVVISPEDDSTNTKACGVIVHPSS